jgi:hypothetical protein
MANTYYNHKVPGVGAAVATSTNGVRLVLAEKHGPFFRLSFALTAASVPITDGGASGAHGSLKIFDFDAGLVQVLGTQHTWTAIAASSAITTAAGDAVGVIALGSAAANVGDGVLTGTEVDFGATRSFTNSSGTSTGAITIGTALTPLDGATTTPVDIYLNVCLTAATADADGTVACTGTYTVWGVITSVS